ncbi:MAG TPA: LLM class F420-dependent oxidoreductase [Ktedonobacterales bacterium]
MAVKFGVFVPQGWRMDLTEITDPIEQYETMTRLAQAADELPQLDSIWVFDHFHTVPRPTKNTTFEAWMITAGLLRDTKRINVGQMVTCNGYRHPSLLAKMASTADVMGHGRLYFGLGGGWYEHEWKAYGFGFPTTRERMGAFREGCEIVHKMWTEDAPTFTGEYYHIDKPINEPKGVRKPHPSFWIGGGGEQVTLKLVAQYGDACNLWNPRPEEVKHKLDVLRRHCAEVGRDYESITRSVGLFLYPLGPGESDERAVAHAKLMLGMSADTARERVIGTPEVIRQRLQAYVDAGIDYVLAEFPGVAYDPSLLQRFAEEVVPHFQ